MSSNANKVVLLWNFVSGDPFIFFDTESLTWRHATQEEVPPGLTIPELKDVMGSYVLLDDTLFALYFDDARTGFIFQASDGNRIALDPLGRADIEPSKDLAGRVEPEHNLMRIYDRNGQLQYRVRYNAKLFRRLFEADMMGGFSPEGRAGDLVLADWDFFYSVAASFRDARELQGLVDVGTTRCEADQPCPRTGYWFTPARSESRRYFQQGEVMPDTKSPWGATIWQWDIRQD